MKLFSVAILLGITILVSSCESIDEVPPRINDNTSATLNMPKPVPLTTEERAEINTVRDEYESIKNNN